MAVLKKPSTISFVFSCKFGVFVIFDSYVRVLKGDPDSMYTVHPHFQNIAPKKN